MLSIPSWSYLIHSYPSILMSFHTCYHYLWTAFQNLKVSCFSSPICPQQFSHRFGPLTTLFTPRHKMWREVWASRAEKTSSSRTKEHWRWYTARANVTRCFCPVSFCCSSLLETDKTSTYDIASYCIYFAISYWTRAPEGWKVKVRTKETAALCCLEIDTIWTTISICARPSNNDLGPLTLLCSASQLSSSITFTFTRVTIQYTIMAYNEVLLSNDSNRQTVPHPIPQVCLQSLQQSHPSYSPFTVVLRLRWYPVRQSPSNRHRKAVVNPSPSRKRPELSCTSPGRWRKIQHVMFGARSHKINLWRYNVSDWFWRLFMNHCLGMNNSRGPYHSISLSLSVELHAASFPVAFLVELARFGNDNVF